MAQWIRYEKGGKQGFGTLEGDTISLHEGEMFAGAKPTGEKLKLADVAVRTPCDPSKMVCLWNNFHQLAAKNDFKRPDDPLYSCARRPLSRAWPTDRTSENLFRPDFLRRRTRRRHRQEMLECERDRGRGLFFGYTCVNDVTAADLLKNFRPSINGRARKASTPSGCSGLAS